MEILKTKNLKKYYGNGDTVVKALDGVDFSVENGEFVAIVGTSGSGKSTLLHMIGGLDRPTAGYVEVAGKDIFSLKDDALTIFRRRKIGFIFQSFNLVPVLNVYENIALPVELDGKQVDESYMEKIIHTLGLEERVDSRPNQLSGGQQQRVAIARALASKPAIILALRLSSRYWMQALSAALAISPPRASSSRTRWPLPDPPMAGLQGMLPTASRLMVKQMVRRPRRAAARAASIPAWPAPITAISYCPAENSFIVVTIGCWASPKPSRALPCKIGRAHV